MAYGGESNAKKIARMKAWWQALDYVPGGLDGNLENTKAFVIAGPEAADVRVLRGSKLRPENVVAVDVDRKAIKSSRTVVPEATYLCGDFVDVCRHKKHRRAFDLLFIDLCSTLSEDVLVDTMRAVAFAGKSRCVLILGHMYGRERELAATVVGSERDAKEETLGEIYSGMHERNYDLTDAQQKRVIQKVAVVSARTSVVKEAFRMQAGVHGLCVVNIGHVSYRSGRRVKGRSCGVPMIYHIFLCSRLVRRKRKEVLRTTIALCDEIAWVRDYTGEGMTSVRDDPDGTHLRAEALQLSDAFGTAQAADLLNLKPGQIAAWRAWRTRRLREA